MTANPACCTPDTPLLEVAKLMLDHDCGQIPVIDSAGSHMPLGVVTDRDIAVRMVALGKNPLEGIAADCMTTPCVSVPEDTSLADCAKVMEASKIRRVPVIDAHGRVCGIVSLADIARCADSATTVDVVKEVSAAA
jgi:CBS domain-containing protein